ncbi:MAG TPA: hybrid sensor histidine kinase/response regulator [Myxococcota bacterium]|nr:hybrid sensor histidine kinase/response regulator [Myxococcota bacterium]
MPADGQPTERPIVLVVDDEDAQRLLLSYILQKSYDVRTAPDGATALAMAQRHTIAVALVDYSMPGMNGAELLSHLTRVQPRCVRFLVTAYAEASVLQQAINLGQIYRFVQKPVDPETLRVDIQRALEHRHAATQLENATRLAAVGTLAGSVLHDLRNCLQMVDLALPLMRADSPESVLESLEMLARARRQMGDLADELLVLSKGEIPHYELLPASLTDVVRDAVAMNRNTSLLAKRHLELEIALNVPPVRLAASRCSRMLTNLIRNAAQATAEGGHIRVSVRLGDRAVLLEVKDDGVGMSSSVRDHIFQPLFSTKGEAGVGLGLSICRAVMEAHGGTLTCESAPGLGTAFIATFPLTMAP